MMNLLYNINIYSFKVLFCFQVDTINLEGFQLDGRRKRNRSWRAARSDSGLLDNSPFTLLSGIIPGKLFSFIIVIFQFFMSLFWVNRKFDENVVKVLRSEIVLESFGVDFFFW